VNIAYISLDEVNQYVAELTLAINGASVDFFASATDGGAPSCDAVVYDLDHLAADDRRHILNELTHSSAKRPAAVHSYNLRRSEEIALRRNGVAVYRRLQYSWLRRLVRGRTRSTASKVDSLTRVSRLAS
jgi:hypothetical protein